MTPTLSFSDLDFIKSYYKQKKSYDKVQVFSSDIFDCNKRQAPLKTFRKVKREDYSFPKQCSKIRKNMPNGQANELIKQVMEVNEYTGSIAI